MLCDIGNGTMIVMAINDRKPVLEQCFTEKYGTYQCVLKAREALTRLCGRTVPDVTIEQVMREGTADVAPEYVQVIREAAADYAAEIMRKLREHEYDPKTMRLWIVGGGGCLIRNFGQYDPNRGDNIDRLSAFKIAAALQNCNPKAALAGMMSKHVVSLYDMCYSTLLHFDMEQWDEKITDCINYLILLKALVKEEQAYGSH